MVFFKRRKLLERQSCGLYIINQCMDVQLDILNNRLGWLRESERDEEAKECESVITVIRYWQEQIRKALRGDFVV